MTWSIIARDGETGRLGIAVASRFLAVGARVPFIESGVGAIATQALLNPFSASTACAVARRGGDRRRGARCCSQRTTDTIIARSTSWTDMAASQRIPARPVSTGADLEGDTFSVAGNMLAGAR